MLDNTAVVKGGALSFPVSSEVIVCPETPMESPDTALLLRSIIQSGEGDPRHTPLQEVAPCQAFNIHEKYDTAVLWRRTSSIINGLQGNFRCAQAAASLTTRRSFSRTACVCRPGTG